MMHTLFGKRIRARLLPIIMAGALTACGSDISQDGAAHFSGSIAISPPDNTIDVGAGAGCTGSGLILEWPYLITVFDSQGRPVGNADIEVGIDFAGNTTILGTVVTQLVDRDTGLVVSNIGDPIPYETETDEFGNKQFFVIFDVSPGCTYGGQLSVVSGSLFQQSEFSIEGN
jgi:hypothetical protein